MIKIISLIATIIFLQSSLFAQDTLTISKSKKELVLNNIKSLITEHYVFPKKADSINQQLEQKFSAGYYDAISDYQPFIKQLHKDIRSISKDYHFGLNYNPEQEISQKQKDKNWQVYQQYNNYGFSKLEILEGNIGYLKLDYFTKPNKKILDPILNFFKHTNGIIIDLRDNNGGARKMIGLLCSYFIEGKVELATVEFPNSKTEKIHTNCCAKILTSKNSFSAAEFFAYSLKHLKRATIVGLPTGGGAHPNKAYKLTDSLSIVIPIGNVINPITKSNWEGSGVTPDIYANYEEAFTKGYLTTLEALKTEFSSRGTIASKVGVTYYQKIIDKVIKVDKKVKE
jgi:hypothetical protein